MALPTLTEWVTDPEIKIDRLFALFFLTDCYQSNSHRVFSFSAAMYYGTQVSSTPATMLKNELETYYLKYFPAVNVEVIDITGDFESKGSLTLSLEVRDIDGKVYDLAKVIEVENRLAKSIISLSNGA